MRKTLTNDLWGLTQKYELRVSFKEPLRMHLQPHVFEVTSFTTRHDSHTLSFASCLKI